MARTKNPPEIAELAETLRLSITRLARVLRQQDGSDLTPSTTSALAMINLHGPLTLGDLAARERVSAPTITRIVEKLQQSGLVTRWVSERDARVAFVEVTDAGRKVIIDARSRRTRWLMAHLGELSQDDLKALRHAAPVLERLVDLAREEDNT
ncbi:MAG: MarR family winged helix-turn-helix transcriptional regulator [Acidimicrobiia bacterium]